MYKALEPTFLLLDIKYEDHNCHKVSSGETTI